MPLPTLPGVATVLLPYVHYSVVFRPDRKLAAVSSVTIDGPSVVDIRRTRDVWRLDDRLPTKVQAGPEVYVGNAFDRGHLTRRCDPAWGTTAQAGSDDTFYYTNAAPQAAVFNESKTLWAGLEDYLLDNAATYDRRLVVHTGPVLAADDPPYRGLQVPRRFFKVVGFLTDGHLAATGYLLDQTPELPPAEAARLAAERAAAGAPPPLGAYKTYQLPIADITTLTGLDFGPLGKVDQYAPPAGLAPERRWRQLIGPADLAGGLPPHP